VRPGFARGGSLAALAASDTVATSKPKAFAANNRTRHELWFALSQKCYPGHNREEKMGNTGFLEVTLRDVAGNVIKDPGTEFTFFRMPGHTQVDDTRRLALPPNPRRFEVPAFPQARAMSLRVAPVLYRSWESAETVFTLGDGQTLPLVFTLARRSQRWQARFTRWNDLSPQFDSLKQVLKASPSLLIADETTPRPFFGKHFQNVDDAAATLAKASLLNLYAKLSLLIEPVEDKVNWFSFVVKLLRIARERLIAVVKPELLDVLRFIRDNEGTFREEYERADSSLHFKNFPAEFRPTFSPSGMLSIKSTEALGNLQLTLAPATDSTGASVLLLDADIDENGVLLKHFFDLLKHRFSGGTHPYDIHEILLHSNRKIDLGYTLQAT
jgi:hypothetical protein